jgi:hypothetical protein
MGFDGFSGRGGGRFFVVIIIVILLSCVFEDNLLNINRMLNIIIPQRQSCSE